MIEKKKNSPPKKGGKTGRNPKIDPAVYRYTVRFNEVEHNRFLAMFEKSGNIAPDCPIFMPSSGQWEPITIRWSRN